MGSESQKPEFDTVVVRFGGEIGIKAAWTRKLYERRLANNIRAAMRQHGIQYEALKRQFGRLYIKTSHAKETCEALSNVFGVSSVSSAVEISSQLKNIIKTSVSVAGSALTEKQTFAVRCRRVGCHTYTSQDVCRHVGRAVLEAYANQVRVDLRHPDLTLEVEVRENLAYVSMESLKGPGGLPLGAQPRIIGFLDEDVDSTVACWMVMKRGCPIIPVHFAAAHHKKANERRIVEAAKILFKWAPGFPRNVYDLSPEKSVAEINTLLSQELRNIVLKRLTYRVAEKLAEKWRAEGIVTGDTLQKPAKESLHFFRLCDEASLHMPIYRPLVGLEDYEIKELARRIGVSGKLLGTAKSQEESLISSTNVSLETVKNEEAKLDINGMVESCLESLRIILL